ncbi:MYB dna-binding domain protein [Colletotrichum higginsianum]|nr:MYB dna-binding domain protein [Colletotrichum higginsianum]
MVQTRAGRGAPDQIVVDDARSARLTRRRVDPDTTTTERAALATIAGATSRLVRSRGKEKVIPSSVTEEEMDAEEEDEEDDDGEEVVRNEPPARFNARHVFKGSMSPPPSESGQVHLPGVEDDGVDDPSEQEADEREDREEAELKENALDSLWHNSEGLARLLRNPKPSKMSWHRLLDVLRRNWFGTRVFFAKQDELFIDLPQTVRHISEQCEIKARAVTVGANATALLEALSEAVADRQDGHFFRLFERLDEDFPAPFCPSDDWHEVVAEEDIDLALDIRTHRLIINLNNLEDERQSPVDVASNIFCAAEASANAVEALQNGPFKGIKGRKAEHFGERAQTVLNLIRGKSVAEAVRALDGNFPLERPLDGSQRDPKAADDFTTKISAWCGKIIDEIEEGLRDSPPLPRESSPPDSLASSMAAQDIVRKDVHDDMLSRPNVHLLAMLSQQKQLSQAPRASLVSTNPRRGTTREPTVNGGLDDYEEDQEQSRREPSLASTDIEGILADLPSTAITRNSIQPPSADVGSSSDHVPAAPVVRSGFTPVNGAKRTQPQSQSQDTDDGFEYDDRRPDPRRRAQLDRDRPHSSIVHRSASTAATPIILSPSSGRLHPAQRLRPPSLLLLLFLA